MLSMSPLQDGRMRQVQSIWETHDVPSGQKCYMRKTDLCNSYRDALVAVVDVDAILSPRDGRFRMATGRLALQHGWLTHCHHNVHWVLPEVIA